MKVDSAELARSAYGPGDFASDDLPQVAFIGRSNVGKSSLLNTLLGRAGLARTSSTPGRTRAVHYFRVNGRWYFVDLPGYGYAKAAKTDRRQWADLVEAYFKDLAEPRRRPRPAVLIQLVDAKVGATDLDAEARQYLASFGLPLLTVATKIDRLGRGQWHRAVTEIANRLDLSETRPIPVSANTGEGIKELWRAITDAIHPTSSA